ncbi:MAG TPA: DUF4982 domain-containing protein [Clostridiales bacterium]|nr:DUF4982 domain-containing protein [Clostridiales bacterium]
MKRKGIHSGMNIKTYLSNCAGKDPMIRVLPPGESIPEGISVCELDPITVSSWNFPGKEGLKATIIILADESEVELFVNGESYGRKNIGAGADNHAIFEVLYQPGIIEVISYHKNFEYGRAVLQ